MGHRLRLLTLFAVVLVVVPTAASAEVPPFVGWTNNLPPVVLAPSPDTPKICVRGSNDCVAKVIREMGKRFDDLNATCDHDALFALTYLRTTEEYHAFWNEGQFADGDWLNHYDAVFASYFFKAADDWQKGNIGAVPEAWRVAFQASKDEAVTGEGSLFLGMSAHINRDLPFVIASIGLVAPDGTSRKPDHDKVNEFLNRVSDHLIPELARRFDPTVDDTQVQGTSADDFANFQLIPAWRENAWRNAEALVNTASNPVLHALVVKKIETDAATIAKAIAQAESYTLSPTFKAADRDAYCRAHHNEGTTLAE